ncbi:hypothetical protein Acr_00g0063890 [Actinidia rufa]|uniref:Uncharacterized protein n=1 Tax=Actinidia rufa TaxID=165716 RepID=A0A7J0DPD8_9ERIC|nr:hypothetical protein Acr_00g0063890 [Actinidia rufa]
MESQQTRFSKPSKAKGKYKQSQRIWTVREEEGLLACMLEEFKDGSKWGTKNGFKSVFFGAVEIIFHKMFPGTTIRANLNIESKFHPKASGMNGRVFPIFPSWQLLFGKDRATGEMAEDAAEIRKMLLMMQLINPVIKNHLLAPMIATFLSIQI